MKVELRKPGVIIPEKIFFRNVIITNAQVNASSDIDSNWGDVSLNVTAKTRFNDSTGCRITFFADINKENEIGEPLIKANFTIEFDFEVENMNDFKSYSDDKPDIAQFDANLGLSLMGIVYSTARGIILTRTAGTILDGILIPVIDVSTLLHES